MTTRRFLAAATLALPMFVGASQSIAGPVVPCTETAHRWQMTDRHAGPEWVYAFGLDGEDALAFGLVAAIECSFFGPVGGFACAVTGVL